MNIAKNHSPAAKGLVKKPLMLALAALALSTAAVPSFAATWWNAAPALTIGKNVTINVRNKGALGNGVHDDTAAIQAAINALPAEGGTVTIPAGHYMVDATKSIRLRSHTRLMMDANATLEVIPNNQTRYYLIKVSKVNNVRIVGGNLVGDRTKHKGTTGEWGYGINISGSQNVLVKQTKISNFWGDGIMIGAITSSKSQTLSDYVTLNGVVSSNNRRQALSITPAKHVYVVNSKFMNSNGALPEAGIDIEPAGEGNATSIRLEKNTFSGSNGNGIELHANISDIAIVNNVMTRNRGFGVLSVSGTYTTISNNKANYNGLAGVRVSGGSHDVAVTGNTLQFNSTRYTSETKTGGNLDRDLQIAANTSKITTSNNVYSNAKYND